MKSIIKVYYNLEPLEIIEEKDFYCFYIKDNKYYFVPFNNDEKQVLFIYNELLKRNIKVNEIVFTIDNKIVVNYNNKLYSLLRVNCYENELVDVNNFFNIFVKYDVSNWSLIWSDKIDYYSYQVHERGLKKESVLNSFSYYVGLAETAIEYCNLLNINNVPTAIQHRRIYANNYEINYLNPLNMVIDFSIRDYSEYIKSCFFNSSITLDDISNYFDKMKYTDIMVNLLYSRLLFPTYYFDIYDEVINDSNDKKLIDIVKKSNDYEEFLKKFYYYFKDRYNLIPIEWIIKT